MNRKAEIKEPEKYPEKTGLTLFALVGGFVLFVMTLGWIIVSMR